MDFTQDSEIPDTLTLSSASQLTSENANESPPIWGHLIGRRAGAKTIELTKESYQFGKLRSCDIYVSNENFRREILNIISKQHFIISRDSTSVPYIKDLSKNGTYLNGVLIGKGNCLALCDGDVIAIGQRINDIYQYKDAPSELISPYFDEKYKITRSIGAGAFGEVYLAFTKKSLHRYAIKKIKTTNRDEIKITNEIKIMENLKNPFVIKMMEAIHVNGFVYIVLEYMEGGVLESRVLRTQSLTEPIAKLYIYQIAQAVAYLHDVGITHRDLKPENVLLATKEWNTLIKVTDFGLSKIVGNSCLMRSLCGTPLYVAPEILDSTGKSPYTALVDIWSLGCICYFALFGKTPFQSPDASDDNLSALFARIKKGVFEIPKEFDEDENYYTKNRAVSRCSIDLINKMLQINPDKRIKVNDIIKHDWFQDSTLKNIMDKLLAKSCSKQ